MTSSLESMVADPQQVADWNLQHALDGPPSLGETVLDPRFLDAGRFAARPGGIELPSEIYVAPEAGGHTRTIPIEGPGSPVLESLGQVMTDQWGFLHARAAKAANAGPLNVNTLTRYVYNTFGVRRILRHLEDQNRRDARILLVTAYETPIHELLESGRVGEVAAVDLSRAAGQVVSDKYAQHPQADKLRLRMLDYSGLEPEFQAAEVDELLQSRGGAGRPAEDAIRRHFSRIAGGRHFTPLDIAAGSFDAVHLPFVLGSLYLGPMTAVIGRCPAAAEKTGRDYTDFLGKEILRSAEAQQAALAAIAAAIAETRRITKRGGLIVINMWARPQPDAPHLVRLSDTPVPREAFDRLMQGFQRLFSGNPQPTLPHTVGHIFATDM